MADIVVPCLSEVWRTEAIRLGVRTDLDLSASEYKALREASGEEGRSPHFSRAERVQCCGLDALLSWRVGLHPAKRRGSKAWLHFECFVDSADSSKARESEEAKDLWASLAEILGEVEVDAWGFWRIPSQAADFTIGLPIELGVTGLAAFPVIRGVRLAKPNPDDPNGDLYSVILNEFGVKSTLQVAASITARLGGETLREGADRLESIALEAVSLTDGQVD